MEQNWIDSTVTDYLSSQEPAHNMIRSCGFIIFRDQPTEFLLMEHTNRLDLPKGHVEKGETDMECALRELSEETGFPAAAIEVDPDFRFTNVYQIRRRSGKMADKELVVFLGRLKEGGREVLVTEHIGYRWVPWSPPHSIQQQTIDPLLAAVAEHLK